MIACVALLALFSHPAVAVQEVEDLPALELADLDAWRAWIRPGSGEAAFEQIDWIADFAGGLRAAAEAQKPLLFWAMNGHPLGCT